MRTLEMGLLTLLPLLSIIAITVTPNFAYEGNFFWKSSVFLRKKLSSKIIKIVILMMALAPLGGFKVYRELKKRYNKYMIKRSRRLFLEEIVEREDHTSCAISRSEIKKYTSPFFQKIHTKNIQKFELNRLIMIGMAVSSVILAGIFELKNIALNLLPLAIVGGGGIYYWLLNCEILETKKLWIIKKKIRIK